MSSHYILIADDDPTLCCIEDLPESLLAKGWRITEGRPMEARFPVGVEFRMSDHFPGLIVPDMINNLLDYWMVSNKMKEVIEEAVHTEIEFLPFLVVNHKGRSSDKMYYISNVLDIRDVVDVERSDFVNSKLERGQFMWLKKFYLRENIADQNVKLCRMAQMPHVMIIDDDLRSRFEDRQISGVKFIAEGEPCMLQ